MSTRDPAVVLDVLLNQFDNGLFENNCRSILQVLSHERKNGTFRAHPMAPTVDLLMTSGVTVSNTPVDRMQAPTIQAVKAEPQDWLDELTDPADQTLEQLLPKEPVLKMTEGQERAWTKLLDWLARDQPFFTLRGYAGTGKSFMMKRLSQLRSHNFYFTAPTNKATKVLSDFIGEHCRTTYSLLGLRMVNEEDKKVLSTKVRVPELGTNPILVIDEAGMVPKFMASLFRQLAEDHGWRFIFVGDPAQLNPIGEERAVVWSFPEKQDRSLLTEVKRFDNQLLALSIRIRDSLKAKQYKRTPIRDDNDGAEGVFVVPRRQMMDRMKKLKIEDWRTTKVGCWRNKTVGQYTEWIRKNLGFVEDWEPNDLIMMAAPVTGKNGGILAYTDEEFQIREIVDRTFEIEEGQIEARVFTLKDSPLVLNVPTDPSELESVLARRAAAASKADGYHRKMLWSRFWELKERFHSVRHGYAMTAHRLQGATLDHIFIDQADVLANPNTREAYRCLYVLATRPRLTLTTF